MDARTDCGGATRPRLSVAGAMPGPPTTERVPLLLSTERVVINARSTYSDPSDADPIRRRDGELVEYVELVPERQEPGVQTLPWRVTVESGVNGEAAEGLVGTATIRTIVKQEAKISG